MPPRRNRSSPAGALRTMLRRVHAATRPKWRRCRTVAAEGGSMLRMLRPDLLCGLGGFILGATALLVVHSAPPRPAPPTRTDILTLAAAGSSAHHARPTAG